MREKPILFSGPMVRALLDGSKTQTRRIVAPRHLSFFDRPAADMLASWNERPLPYGQPGDRLWVREAWRSTGDGGRCNSMPPRDMQPHNVWHEADGLPPADECAGKLRPSMFMPRWASRILLEITDVRVERLQDISEADAKAEGADPLNVAGFSPADLALIDAPLMGPQNPYRNGFASLWWAINGPGAWEANPWAWAVSFKRVTP